MSESSWDIFKYFPKKMLDARLLLFYNVKFVMIIFRDHPYITSTNGLGGWVQKKVIFADIQYSTDVVGGWVWKSAKMWLRNYVIYYQLKFEPLQSKNQGAQKWHLQNNTDNSHLVSNGRIYQVTIEKNNHFMAILSRLFLFFFILFARHSF